MKQPFYINNRFLINPTMNIVTDRDKNQESRIEPRLISLLCLLSDHAGELVHRETLIKEIWNDYGGADEGLNQGISFLRKVLDDSEKRLIETVPKKGYVLKASVTAESTTRLSENDRSVVQKKRSQWRYLVPLLILLTAISVWIIFRNKRANSISPDVLNKDQIQDSTSNRDTIPAGSNIRPDVKRASDTSLLPDTRHLQNEGKVR